MAEEKKEKWLNYMAITTVAIAVCATLSTFKGGGFSTKSLLCQSKASDKWAHYQAKSIKSYLYQIQKENIELQVKTMESESPKTDTQPYKDKISYYKDKLKGYDDDQKQIKQEAQDLEAERDESKLHSQSLGMAVIFLQVSILLSSIGALTKKKYIWYISLISGVIGAIYFANGFLLFFLA